MRSRKVRDSFSSIFPHFLLLLHFSTARLRLRHDWELCRVQTYQKKRAERETGPKQRRFGLFFLKGISSNIVILAYSFKIIKEQNDDVLDIVHLKEQASKRRRFGHCSFKRTGFKTASFWTHKINKKLGLCNSTEEEEE